MFKKKARGKKATNTYGTSKEPWQCFGNFWFQICFFWALVSQQQLLPVTQLSSSLKVRQLRVVHSSTESVQIRHPFGAELQEILW